MTSYSTALPSQTLDHGALHGQIVLILVGLIGSGKSTFAQALEDYFPEVFKRCNQDDLGGDRRRVESLARESLRQGLSVCIDRTNFDSQQRSHWIRIAREFPRTLVWVIVFETPYEECKNRLEHRTCHPTITSAERGIALLARFASDFRYPTPDEGYHRLLQLKPSDHPSPVYTHEDIVSILDRLRDSLPNLMTYSSPHNSPPSHSGRGRSHHSHNTPGWRNGTNRSNPSHGGFKERNDTSREQYASNDVASNRGAFSWRSPTLLENEKPDNTSDT